MNGQLMEYWGRTMLMALQGQHQTDSITNWFQRMYQDMTRLNLNLLQVWGTATPAAPRKDLMPNWQQTCWDTYMQMQKLSLQWIGMYSNRESEAQAKKIAQLEEQVEEQARTIECLQGLIDKSETGNSEIVGQFRKLIEQQGRQFKQLTASVGEYLNSATEGTGTPEQS